MNYKKVILLISIIQFSLTIKSQSWLEVGASWTYNLTDLETMSYNINKIEIVGDTLLDKRLGKVIQRDFQTCDGRPKIDIVSEENEALYQYNFEESAFTLLFDFKSNVGDTVEIPLWEGTGLSSSKFYAKVISIDLVEINNRMLREFKVQYDLYDENELNFDEFDFQDKIVEGIGSLGNLALFTDNGLCHMKINTGLRCFNHPEFGEFKFVDEPCDSIRTIGVSTGFPIELKEYSLFPNPASHTIVIQTPNIGLNRIVELLDMNGRVQYIRRTNFELGQIEIDISALQQGKYVVRISSVKDGKFSVERFLKID